MNENSEENQESSNTSFEQDVSFESEAKATSDLSQDSSAENQNAENSQGDSEEALDPKVQKLLDYAGSKQVVSWDEMTEILTLEFVNSPKMETVIQLLNKNNIPIMDENNGMMDEDEDVDQEDDDGDSSENDISVEDESKIDDVEHHHLLSNEKDSKIDDPIRLYLREIGKERLLTADEEKKFSKKMLFYLLFSYHTR